MVAELINKKEIDIHKFPTKIIPSKGDLTIGDLHGNALKLIHFCLKHRIVKFKDEVDAQAHYQELINIYEDFATIIEPDTEIKILPKKIKMTENKIEDLKLQRAFKKSPELRKQIEEAQNKLTAYKEKLKNLPSTLSSNVSKIFNKYKLSTNQNSEINSEASNESSRLKECLKFLHDGFTKCIEKLEVIDEESLLRLIGDELADRGSSDIFTLILYDFLKSQNIKVTTLLSNHGLEFLSFYQHLKTQDNLSYTFAIDPTQTYSLNGLILLLKNNIVQKNEVLELIEQSYLPTVKVIDYTFTEDGIRLFTHAPIKFAAIKYMAENLKIKYNDSTPQKLAETIDKINNKFQTKLRDGSFMDLFPPLPEGINAHNLDTQKNDSLIKRYPFWYITWNRFNKNPNDTVAIDDTLEQRPEQVGNIGKGIYNVYYVHGHDAYQSIFPHITTLDTNGGKESLNTRDERIIQYNKHAQSHKHQIAEIREQRDNYLQSLKQYKVLNSSESQTLQDTNESQALPDTVKKNIDSNNRKNNFAMGGVALSLIIIGIALTLTGLGAPIGLTLVIGGALLSGLTAWRLLGEISNPSAKEVLSVSDSTEPTAPRPEDQVSKLLAKPKDRLEKKISSNDLTEATARPITHAQDDKLKAPTNGLFEQSGGDVAEPKINNPTHSPNPDSEHEFKP